MWKSLWTVFGRRDERALPEKEVEVEEMERRTYSTFAAPLVTAAGDMLKESESRTQGNLMLREVLQGFLV